MTGGVQSLGERALRTHQEASIWQFSRCVFVCHVRSRLVCATLARSLSQSHHSAPVRVRPLHRAGSFARALLPLQHDRQTSAREAASRPHQPRDSAHFRLSQQAQDRRAVKATGLVPPNQHRRRLCGAPCLSRRVNFVLSPLRRSQRWRGVCAFRRALECFCDFAPPSVRWECGSRRLDGRGRVVGRREQHRAAPKAQEIQRDLTNSLRGGRARLGGCIGRRPLARRGVRYLRNAPCAVIAGDAFFGRRAVQLLRVDAPSRSRLENASESRSACVLSTTVITCFNAEPETTLQCL